MINSKNSIDSNYCGITENAVFTKDKKKENYKPRTLIDQTLEMIDPTPNIYTLFVQFNERFFRDVLLPVAVKWSNRMTSCAGICSYHPRTKECTITLSAPLLKLRPRKDLVETLLHEMIHGYLFLTNNDRDRDGHGPQFCKHMNRINKEAGTSITIYHTFHDEVKLYQQHWWRCNGPCQKRAPYFGTVRRAMNRAPGPSDFWWAEHQKNCGGQFIKTKEPENYKSKNTKKLKVTKPKSNISDWLSKTKAPFDSSQPSFAPKHTKPTYDIQDSFNNLKKLGNSSNNIHGWGTAGPSGSNKLQTPPISRKPKFVGSGTLGGSNTGRSNLLTKFIISTPNKNKTDINERHQSQREIPWKQSDTAKSLKNNYTSDVILVECPVCNIFVLSGEVDKHASNCSTMTDKIKSKESDIRKPKSKADLVRKADTNNDKLINKQPRLENSANLENVSCPNCNKDFKLRDINDHLDKCLIRPSYDYANNTVTLDSDVPSSPFIQHSTPTTVPKNKIKIDDVQKCLVCGINIPSKISLNDHLEDCVGKFFNDDSLLSSEEEQGSEIHVEDDKYPCPVCMELVGEPYMNSHLDICLNQT